jgi:nucleoside 2-deoxyribosyltransferase
MKIYLAGPLFTQADRDFLESCAQSFESVGIECFVPHRIKFASLDPDTVYAEDGAGVRGANAMVAWLDGPVIDDGTACEIGIFAELCRREPRKYVGIVGLATDWRTMRRRESGTVADGLNLFVTGAIRAHGEVAFTLERVHDVLSSWSEMMNVATEV